ncbi:MAG: outer membrane protein [Syntrophothermus sp.]
MKKYLALLLIVISCSAFAQDGSAAFKLGFFNPADADAGFIIGYEGTHRVDENFYIGWSFDWFHRNYTDKKLVSDYNQVYPGQGGEVNELRAKTNIHDLPLMFVLKAEFPVAPRTSAYGTGGFGAEILLINYRNFQNPEQDDFHAAFAFNWRIGAGMSYAISRRSDIFGEITYHSSVPSWEYQIEDPLTHVKRTYEREFDMSGMMLRIGYRFFY